MIPTSAIWAPNAVRTILQMSPFTPAISPRRLATSVLVATQHGDLTPHARNLGPKLTTEISDLRF